MIAAAIAAAAITSGPDMRAYRLRIHAQPGTQVALRSSSVQGWVESFCTARVCAPGHVVEVIPASGTAVMNFDVYRIDARAPHRARVTIASPGVPSVTLDVAIR